MNNNIFLSICAAISMMISSPSVAAGRPTPGVSRGLTPQEYISALAWYKKVMNPDPPVEIKNSLKFTKLCADQMSSENWDVISFKYNCAQAIELSKLIKDPIIRSQAQRALAEVAIFLAHASIPDASKFDNLKSLWTYTNNHKDAVKILAMQPDFLLYNKYAADFLDETKYYEQKNTALYMTGIAYAAQGKWSFTCGYLTKAIELEIKIKGSVSEEDKDGVKIQCDNGIGGYLGMSVGKLEAADLSRLGIVGGIIVAETPEEGTPAQKAGLTQNDILISFNGVILNDSNWRRTIGMTPPGSKGVLQILRNGQRLAVEVTVGLRKIF